MFGNFLQIDLFVLYNKNWTAQIKTEILLKAKIFALGELYSCRGLAVVANSVQSINFKV